MDRPQRRDPPPKSERLRVFLERYRKRLPAASFEQAYGLLVTTLNEVEDELTGIPNEPDHWMDDGRLYPPQQDSWRSVHGYPGLTRMRSVGHNTYIAANGAVEIRLASDPVAPPGANSTPLFGVAGKDGKGVWDR